MSTAELKSDVKPELNDSGCVQDEAPPKKPVMEAYTGQAQLLDLSDDVLLYILKYCSAHDLKALGFTCARLGALVLERSLWTFVDGRDVGYGRARLRWLVDHGLHRGTRSLLLTGLAREAAGCEGHVDRTEEEEKKEEEQGREELLEFNRRHVGDGDSNNDDNAAGAGEPPGGDNNQNGGAEPPYPLIHHRSWRIGVNTMDIPRHRICSLRHTPAWPWPEEPDSPQPSEPSEPDPKGDTKETGGKCAGPIFTLNNSMLALLRGTCPQLAHLHLEYCNINCNKTSLSNFPATLQKLSLRGTRCYNHPIDRSFLYQINDYLPVLQYLDLSECEWLEPASLLPLSKMGALLTLLMRDCPRLTEFVAYVSLATRYGFKTLKVLDWRGSPVGDSEVSALGWLPALQELHLGARAAPPPPAPHRHYRGERRPRDAALRWEAQVPEYYRVPEMDASEAAEAKAEEEKRRLFAAIPNVDISYSYLAVRSRPCSSRWLEIPPPVVPPLRGSQIEITIEQERSPENETEREPTHENGNAKENTGKDTETKEENTEENRIEQEKALENGTEEKTTENNGIEPEKARSVNENKEGNKKDRKKTENKTEPENTQKRKISDNADVPEEKPGPSKRKKEDKSDKDDDDDDDDEDDDNRGTICINFRHSTLEYRRKLQDDIQYDSDTNDKESQSSKQDSDSDISSQMEDDKKLSSEENSAAENEDQRESALFCRKKSNKQNKRKHAPNVNAGASTSTKSSDTSCGSSKKRRKSSDDSQDVSEDGPSQNGDEKDRTEDDSEEESPRAERSSQYVTFRRNMDPLVVEGPIPPERREEARPHVFYVNIGQQVHALHRLVPNRPIFHFRRNPEPQPPRFDASTNVSDTAIRRFGRADGEEINIVNIGPNGPQVVGRDTSARPNRSNLRILSATGYRSITNRSLVHLATAAPHLQMIDFTNTSVTQEGVDNFKSLRLDCEVKFSTFKSEENEE